MPLKTDELRTRVVDTMPTPAEVEAAHPVTDSVAHHITTARRAISDILNGRDPRLLVIVGPCSIHDPAAARDYAAKLKTLADQYTDQLLVVMRTYFEKPRTVVGWKGLINDPHLDGSGDIRAGLFTARELLLDINKMGLPTATEFLDMITGQYIADLISWGAIGARTTESQIHREMASALSSPVGFKNGTDGNITIAVDAIRASRESHLFCSPDKHGAMTIYRTAGNPDGHVILRGGHQPNYHAHNVQAAANTLAGFGLPTKLVVDFSHGNCQKQHRRQLEVCADIAAQIHGGEQAIAGIMAESFLQEGNQAMGSADSRTYGQSITDPCLGWEDTEKVLAQLANAVMARKNT
ncbi:3-deoxy-7-phosphoheptulonate synthase [Salinivibrio costicola]|uniref:Phospho-2-dehydro-3-deoxyheptonate aldolase n=1 Tax=Salinivibrio costicola subsp. alcaliphilus TaxID=272773 RepID=A0ABX3KT88_SALCS|nr:3-deoxy-7-phosphoheptulonate synthase [Salinivibrio costicola]OOF34965.1 3-deoxy-7-phosphoheptulonate synthase [Salinivibrio costicola subsp. alcaliphilus]